MKYLIQEGGDPDYLDAEGQTPIFYAVRNGQFDCVEYLIKECTIDLHRKDTKERGLIFHGHKNQRI